MKGHMLVGLAALVLGLMAGGSLLLNENSADSGLQSSEGTPSGVTAVLPKATIPEATRGVLVESEYVEDFLVTTRQFAEADIVLLGTIEKVDAARWNSPDGKEWKPADTIAEPMPYTTIYVAPSEIVKGTPKFGTPVAVRFAGGAVGPNSEAMSAQIGLPDLEVGTEVLVFGKDEQRYGPGAVYTPAGYWLLSDMHSLFQRDGAQYLSVAGVRKADTGIVNLEELRRMAGK